MSHGPGAGSVDGLPVAFAPPNSVTGNIRTMTMQAEHDESWRKELRAARRALKVTIPEVARAASLSIETVRGYENGRRTPTREHLIHVLQAINLPFMESNAILNAAGFAALRTRFPEDDFPEYFFVRGELDAAVERVPWPEFVAGDLLEVVAANRAAEAIWGIDFQHEKRTRTRAQLNLLSVASDHHFADRVGNWDEIVEFMASLYKGVPSGETLDRPSTFFNDVLAEFAKGTRRSWRRWGTSGRRPSRCRRRCGSGTGSTGSTRSSGRCGSSASSARAASRTHSRSTTGTRSMRRRGGCWSR